jgi:hypothetical protein
MSASYAAFSMIPKSSNEPLTTSTELYLAENAEEGLRRRAVISGWGCFSRSLFKTLPPMKPVAPVLNNVSPDTAIQEE